LRNRDSMLDIRWIRDDPDAFDEALRKRGLPPSSADILALDRDRRAAQTRFQDLQQRRNETSKRVGQAKAKGEDAAALIADVGRIKEEVQAVEEEERTLGQRLEALLAGFPNAVAADVPVAADESGRSE